ncbi:hypothetical protein BYT27DRAFT_7180798 [Phlegmacium glaucopus]|nr:hypothetical protein BYT27DRAFT_7180798 [Phlegmacium glaucopus]
MAIRKKTSTTRLPQILQQQLDEAASTSTSANNQNHRSWNQNSRKSYLAAASRKDARKQERLTRKQNKATYFSSSHISNTRKRGAEEELVESPQRKKLKSHGSNTAVLPKASKSLPAQSVVPVIAPVAVPKSTDPSPSIKVSKQLTTATKGSTLEKTKKKTVNLKPPPKEDKEDAYITYLESKLGMDNGGKKKGKKAADEDDGLDDLMTWADSFVAPITKSEEEDEDEDAVSFSSEDVSESESSGDYEEEWHGIGESLEHSGSESTNEVDTPKSPQPATSSAYVPPHLRNAQHRDDSNSEAILKLTRQLKGLLNRMGEQNIGTILDSVEEVYRNHRRNDVTSTLTTLIIDGISSHSSLLDSYVVLYAAFVSSLHKTVGVEFAAHLVQTLVASYERHYASMQDTTISSTDTTTEQDGKECSNLLVLISELYNFQVVSCVLVFDVIRYLLNDNLTEFKVELLLKILRNSGQQLRQDDPSALKDIIEIVQGKVSMKDDGVNSRTRFMIETLTNLKNNKSKRNITQNQGGAAVERMKKFLSGLSKTRHVLSHEPLRVSLEDLRSAESKGKWWLVGAAWSGDPLVDKQTEFSKTTGVTGLDQQATAAEDNLIKLARSQGMNTDIRRGIFVVLMSSDDYIDAHGRLSQLNLTEVQQREIIRVLLHCCGNESSYNPYYSLVGQQLSRTTHAYKITLQFTLWDFLRDLGESNVGGAAVIKNAKEDIEFDVKSMSKTRIQHVAKAYAWWIAKDCASLMILKPVDFTKLKPQTHDFFKQLFIQIFINSQRSTPLADSSTIKDLVFTRNRNAIEEIFIKISRVETLAMGLVFFLSESFPEKYFKSDDGFSKFLKWAVDVAKDTLRTGIDLIPSTV